MACKSHYILKYTSLVLVLSSAFVHLYQFQLLSWHFSRVEFDEDDDIAVYAIHIAIRLFRGWALFSSLLGFLAVYGAFSRRPELVRIYIIEQLCSHLFALLTFIPFTLSTYPLSQSICSVLTRGEWLSRSFYEFGSPEVCEERWQAIFIASVVVSTILWLFSVASTFLLWRFYRKDNLREKKLVKSLYGPIALSDSNSKSSQKKSRRKYSINSMPSRPRSKSLLPTDKTNISITCPTSTSPTSTSFPPLPHSPHSRPHTSRYSKQTHHKRSSSTCASIHTSVDHAALEKRIKEEDDLSPFITPNLSQKSDTLSSGTAQITSWATKRRSTFPAVRESQSFQVHFLKDGSFSLAGSNGTGNIELDKLDEKKG